MSQKNMEKHGAAQANQIEIQPKVFDKNYFLELIELPNAGQIQPQVQLMKTQKDAQDKKLQEQREKFRDLFEEKIQLKMMLMEMQIDNSLIVENTKKYNLSLTKLQENFNGVIDPFNKAKDLELKNKTNYQKVAKIYNERNKKIDAYKDQLNKNVQTVVQKRNDVCKVIGLKQQSLSSAEEVLAKKLEELDKILDSCQQMEVKMKEINMEHLKLEGQELKCVKDEKQSDLLKLRNDASKTENAIREMSETKNGAQNNLKSMQSEIDEETASKVVLEQRVDNEKNLTQQILHSKFVKSDQRLEDANLKLAGELRHIVTSIGENDQQLEELNHKKVEINMNVRNLELTKVEKLKFMKEVAGGFTKSSVDNRGLLDKITSMAQTLEYVKKNTLLVQGAIEKMKHIYDKKIRKEQRRQTLVGVIDDESASSKSSEDAESIVSKMSSSLIDIEQIEKMDFETTMNSLNGIPDAKK